MSLLYGLSCTVNMNIMFWILATVPSAALLSSSQSSAESCDGHLDASCLPRHLLSPPACQTELDCQAFDSESVQFWCSSHRCRPLLICPTGFFSWHEGCLPYASAGEHCPAGSDQCLQGLLCVDGVCLGACKSGDILVEGVCKPATFTAPATDVACLAKADCETLGCPPSHPVCTPPENPTGARRCCQVRRHRQAAFVPEELVFVDHVISRSPQNQAHRPPVSPRISKSRSGPFTVIKSAPQPKVKSAPGVIRSISALSCISYGEVQVGGYCYPKAQAGQACSYSVQCPSSPGQQPYLCIDSICQLAVRCSMGYFVYNNNCLAYHASGQSCTVTSVQCLPGTTCESGACFSGCADNQVLVDGVCVGYAGSGCIQRSCETDACPSTYPSCNYVPGDNAYLCCLENASTALMCPNTGLEPQLSFGTNIPVDCVAKTCARGYTCQHTAAGRYLCCPRRTASTPPPFDPMPGGYLRMCVSRNEQRGCMPVSSTLCFCAYPGMNLLGGRVTLEPIVPTFTTALPNVTTTTATTTTTTSASACMQCGWDTISLVNGTEVGETVTPINGIQVVDGCQELTVECDISSESGMVVYMLFNTDLGGPNPNYQSIMTATLICENGAWTYTENGVTAVITRVQCFATEPVDTTTTSTTTASTSTTDCTLGDVTLNQGSLDGEQPTVPDGIQTVDGVYEITVVCTTSTTGAYIYMAFNNYLGGPSINYLSTVSATLTCLNGGWYYTEGGVTTQVTIVDCLEATGRRRAINNRIKTRNRLG